LSTDNPKALQRKAWFDVMISFGRREEKAKTDDKEHEFVEFARS
jgi:hypothetical protein